MNGYDALVAMASVMCIGTLVGWIKCESSLFNLPVDDLLCRRELFLTSRKPD
jgi:hypothetical protein